MYRSRAVKYPWAPDTYVAFPWRLHGIAGKEQRQTDLAVSRDGENWTVYDEPYFPYGVDYAGAKVIESLAIDGLVRRGDELWQFSELRFSGHVPGRFEDDPNRDVMMRYKQRLDGFVALQAENEEGWALTRPFSFDGERLELNVDAEGAVRVGILDAEEVEYAGFAADACDPIQADSTHQVVTWGGHSDVSSLAGRVVRLRFEMSDARVFAFQFTK